MKKDKLMFAKDILIVIIFSVVLAYIFTGYLLPVLLPFLISFAVASIMHRPADFVASKLKINKKFIRASFAVAVILVAVSGFVFGVIRLATEAWGLLVEFSETGTIGKIIEIFKSKLGIIGGTIGIDGDLELKIEDAFNGVLSKLLSGASGIVTSVASAVPKILFFIIVCAISSVYFAIDLEKIEKAIVGRLPSSLSCRIDHFKETSIKTLTKYARSYFLIMLLTFAMMLFGLTILGVRYSWLLAFVIAVLDMLPILGIGIILIPYSLFSFLAGDVKLGIGLLVLYGIASVIRQIAEPGILGKNLGIHPLITLILMYIGYSVFGFLGLLVLPFIAVIFSGYSKNNIPPISKSESEVSSRETHE